MPSIKSQKTGADAYSAILLNLLEDVSQLRAQITQISEQRLTPFKSYFRNGFFTRSAINLGNYLALRQFDLRQLQSRLAQVGLSSLGRAEASVTSTLDSVIYILGKATGADHPSSVKNPSEYGFNRGQQLLEQHTLELFGPYHEKGNVHIMITLATDAAWNYDLLVDLFSKGMTCARINCAHDSVDIWHSMIRNVRRAEIETGRSCRVMMDLAGHKIRTGPIEPGPAVVHVKVKKDACGKIIGPGYLLLVDSASTADFDEYAAMVSLTIPGNIAAQIRTGDKLHLSDARGKQVVLLIEKETQKGHWLVSSDHGCYLQSSCEMILETSTPEKAAQRIKFTIEPFFGPPQTIRVFVGEHLLLTDMSQPGRPALVDHQGQQVQPAQIACTLKSALEKVRAGDPVWIDDGKLGAIVESVSDQGVLLTVTRAGTNGVKIGEDKGINFPQTELALPALSEKDKNDLDFACIHADMIGFSFVESMADMQGLISELAKRNATDQPVIAKIETARAVKNLPEIILSTIGQHSLGVMIARGDLAVELGSARLAEVQEEMLWLCEAAHVPVIWATQVLESIAKKGTHSRPEFTDAAMGVRAECVMLNKGPYIGDALEALVNVMIRMHEHQHKKFSKLRALDL